ncbi:uncharacterized protein CTRU02_203538 [Colletotrichum truncatum]|uniref:Uncharacterized protein n=1 Tax=Colletotrichum truncatum TaxID=5467 RepID=A0ACC3Z9M9_COLTU|nr:uncharacterized protein CTRU02_05922 [Colletotrichum truncatum]KAF6793667.1 hypothetical protein CTRU02_05922 [Colletotrichum truncatum]
MSVREKLLTGVNLSFQKKEEHDALHRGKVVRRHEDLISDAMGVGGIHLTDIILDLPHNFRQDETQRVAEQEVLMKGMRPQPTTYEEKAEADTTRSQRYAKRAYHYRARLPYVYRSGRRLNIVTSTQNESPHKIKGMEHRQRADQIMNVEWRQEQKSRRVSMDFSSFQEKSMRINGYRERTIQSIHFQLQGHNSHHEIFGPPLGKEVFDGRWDDLRTGKSFLHQGDQSISMTDLDIIDVDGVKRSWLCIEICGPLINTNGPVPLVLDPMPRSSIKIAVPAGKVSLASTIWQPQMICKVSQNPTEAQNVDGLPEISLSPLGEIVEPNNVRLRMSRHGIPIFVTQSKLDHVPGHYIIEDFFSAQNVFGLPWKETDRRVKLENKMRRKSEFWEDVHQQAREDRKQWCEIQQAMARDSCVVDIVFQGDWVHVPPNAQEQHLNLWSRPIPRQISAPSRQNTRHDKNLTGHAIRHSNSSGLRNEIKW